MVDANMLVIINAFVGGMVGLERSILPQIATVDFAIAAKTAILSFIIVLYTFTISVESAQNSRQVIINPFKGHPKEARNVLNRENWETFKEFAVLDGAIIIDDDGIAQAAGRYVGISWDIYLEGGLGGRHLAAASISKNTGAVAMAGTSSAKGEKNIKGRKKQSEILNSLLLKDIKN